MKGTMKAAVMTGIGKMRIEEREIPQPKVGEALVKLDYVGICGSDIHYYESGAIGDFIVEPPFLLGHEPGGVVVELGEGVTNLKIGDRVSIEPGKTCGHCEFCRDGRYNLCPEMSFYALRPWTVFFRNMAARNYYFGYGSACHYSLSPCKKGVFCLILVKHLFYSQQNGGQSNNALPAVLLNSFYLVKLRFVVPCGGFCGDFLVIINPKIFRRVYGAVNISAARKFEYSVAAAFKSGAVLPVFCVAVHLKMQVLAGRICARVAHIPDNRVLRYPLPRPHLGHLFKVHICYGKVGGLSGSVVFTVLIYDDCDKAAAAVFSCGHSVLSVTSDKLYRSVSEGINLVASYAVHPKMAKAQISLIFFAFIPRRWFEIIYRQNKSLHSNLLPVIGSSVLFYTFAGVFVFDYFEHELFPRAQNKKAIRAQTRTDCFFILPAFI